MKRWRITATRPSDEPAYLSNGLVGLRVPPVPVPGGTALVNGFVGLSPELRSEEIAEAPYPVGVDLCLDGAWVSEHPHRAAFREQTHDASCGELSSRFSFRAADATAEVDVLTFCSRTQPALTLQELRVRVDRPCRLVLRSQLDPRHLHGSLAYRCMPGRDHQPRDTDTDAVLLWESRGGLGLLGASLWSEVQGAEGADRRRNNYGHEEDLQLTDYSLDAVPGKEVVLRQAGALVPGLLHAEPHWQAHRLVNTSKWFGFDELRRKNREAWEELWKGRVVVSCDDARWQDALDASFYYVHASVSPASPCSVAPFGLSRRSEYHGHVFWDTETFLFPPVLLTAPDAARALLDYRSRRLPAAHANALLNGYRGVQFPWQTGLTGDEVTSYYCQGQGEHHINLDIAFAFAQFVYATDNERFLREQAWPVLQGVADWIVSRVERTSRGFEIRHVTGIDEGLDNVNNDAYTNMASMVVLRVAQHLGSRLGHHVQRAWREVQEGLFVPLDEATGAILKHDRYVYDGGLCCPDPLAAFFPLGCRRSAETDAATYRYYIEKAESYFGMPMLASLFGVWACRVNDRALALRFFEQGILPYVVEPFHMFAEASTACRGPFVANAGKGVFLTNPAGFLMACMMGLTGLELDGGPPESWGKHPVVLPEGWEEIRIERMWAHGRPASWTARHGEEAARLDWHTEHEGTPPGDT